MFSMGLTPKGKKGGFMKKILYVFPLAAMLFMLATSFDELIYPPVNPDDDTVAARDRDRSPNAYDRYYDSGPALRTKSTQYYYQDRSYYYSPSPAPRRTNYPNPSDFYWYYDSNGNVNYIYGGQ